MSDPAAEPPGKTVRLSITPYPGKLWVCTTRKAFAKACLRILGEPNAFPPERSVAGRYMAGPDKEGMQNYLIWASNAHTMAHEVSHAILDLFDQIGIDPRAAGGEPFCYLLSQILLDIETHTRP